MPTSYFMGFSVVRRDSQGFIITLPNEDLDVYNVTQASSLGTLTTDDYGVIPSQSVSADTGDLLRFSVSGYAPTFERTVYGTLAEVLGDELSYVVDDQLAYSLQTAVYVEVWALNLDNAEAVTEPPS